jgi:hypothetical protein
MFIFVVNFVFERVRNHAEGTINFAKYKVRPSAWNNWRMAAIYQV